LTSCQIKVKLVLWENVPPRKVVFKGCRYPK
jgi:hypothetical protein